MTQDDYQIHNFVASPTSLTVHFTSPKDWWTGLWMSLCFSPMPSTSLLHGSFHPVFRLPLQLCRICQSSQHVPFFTPPHLSAPLQSSLHDVFSIDVTCSFVMLSFLATPDIPLGTLISFIHLLSAFIAFFVIIAH